MRVALLHSFYSRSQPSGENVVVDAQLNALREKFDVRLFSVETDERSKSSTYPLEAALTVATGYGSLPTREISAFQPDIVHVHNLFPNFGKSRVTGLRTPVVATLHNFRHSCAAGTFYRDGEECTSCLLKGSFESVRYGCYRSSRLASIPLALATRGGAKKDTLLTQAARVIVLSERARRLHQLSGLSPEKVRVLPNFVDLPADRDDATPHPTRWLYMGRLSPEKGIRELVSAWPSEFELDVVGDGPLRAEISQNTPSSVRVMGAMSHSRLQDRMMHYQGVVIPSRWAEGAVPLTYVEAISHGLPVIALEGNGAADDIQASSSGIVLKDWQNLSLALQRIQRNRPTYQEAARRRAVAQYSRSSWLTNIDLIYSEAITHPKFAT